MKLTLACNVNVADVVLAVVLILSSIVPIFSCLMHTDKKYVYFLPSFLMTFFPSFLDITSRKALHIYLLIRVSVQ